MNGHWYDNERWFIVKFVGWLCCVVLVTLWFVVGIPTLAHWLGLTGIMQWFGFLPAS